MRKKDTTPKAEFINLLSRVLTHPECPGRLWDRITDALVEEQNIRQAPLSSPEYITCALYGDEVPDVIPSRSLAESGNEWPEFLEGVS